ncbi:hypothetical protein [Paraurantiacibacter namhicola]|uniref:hypothetical protein n=1 Tax=Paraurantiacibacter namhicola TaxID=645517 RepID=UPI0012ED49FE|nr:hypothetical protein [Paraurantiacibacter namhicola]
MAEKAMILLAKIALFCGSCGLKDLGNHLSKGMLHAVLPEALSHRDMPRADQDKTQT